MSSSGKIRLSIIQYNCQKNWSNVLQFFNKIDQGSADELYDIIALQEFWPFEANGTRDSTRTIPENISKHFELIQGSIASHLNAKFRNPRVCCFVNRRLSRAPWYGCDERFKSSDLLTLALPFSKPAAGANSYTIFIHNVYLHPIPEQAASTIDQLKQALEQVEKSTPNCSTEIRDHIVLGDINIHHPLWGGLNANHDTKFFDFIPIVEGLNLTLLLPRGSITHT